MVIVEKPLVASERVWLVPTGANSTIFPPVQAYQVGLMEVDIAVVVDRDSARVGERREQCAEAAPTCTGKPVGLTIPGGDVTAGRDVRHGKASKPLRTS